MVSVSQEVKVRVILLVKEELGPGSLGDNVPGIHRAGGARQCGQNGLGGKHIPPGLCQVSDDRVSCGGEDAPGGDAAKGLILVPGTRNTRCPLALRLPRSASWKVHFLFHLPVTTYFNRRASGFL